VSESRPSSGHRCNDQCTRRPALWTNHVTANDAHCVYTPVVWCTLSGLATLAVIAVVGDDPIPHSEANRTPASKWSCNGDAFVCNGYFRAYDDESEIWT